MVWVQNFLKDNLKFEPLREISTSSGFMEKDTTERRLLSSLLNDLGKQFVYSDYHLENQIDRKLVFNAFWAFFPRFDEFEKDLCSFKEKLVSFKTMCVSIFSTSVSVNISRVAKKMSKLL